VTIESLWGGYGEVKNGEEEHPPEILQNNRVFVVERAYITQYHK
jgi:hypothetical protein